MSFWAALTQPPAARLRPEHIVDRLHAVENLQALDIITWCFPEGSSAQHPPGERQDLLKLGLFNQTCHEGEYRMLSPNCTSSHCQSPKLQALLT